MDKSKLMVSMFENVAHAKSILVEALSNDVTPDDLDLHIEIVEMYKDALLRTKWINGIINDN